MRFSPHLLCPIVLTATLATQLNAAEEIQDNVPLDLVKALMASNSPFGIRLYYDLPDNFPAIDMPDSAELLGGADMGHSLQAVLRVDGDGLQQRSQLMTSLENSGYILLTQAPAAHPSQTGFVAPTFIPPQMPLQYCHDVHGMVTVRVTGGSNAGSANAMYVNPSSLSLSVAQGAPVRPFFVGSSAATSSAASTNTPSDTVIHITVNGGATNPGQMTGGMNCAQMLEQYSGRGQPGAMMMNLGQYMPRMELPAAAVAAASGRPPGSFSSGSRNGMESGTDIRIDWDLETVLRYFADQIERQGWDNDTQSVGNISASASWTREVDELALFGSLRVVKTGDMQYRLQFQVQNMAGMQQ